jgi:hypothetical protein
MGHMVWATLIFPTLQLNLVWVARIPVCGRHLLSESLGAFPELQDRNTKYPQYFAGKPVPPLGGTPNVEEDDDDEDDDNE